MLFIGKIFDKLKCIHQKYIAVKKLFTFSSNTFTLWLLYTKTPNMLFLRLYLIALVLFFLVDMLWLGWLARGFYQRHLGTWMAPQVNWSAAIIFYLLFVAGLVYFATLPAIEADSGIRALLNGAFFGLVTYATYELTNFATLRDWPLQAVVIDMLWGTVLCAVVSWGSWKVAGWMLDA